MSSLLPDAAAGVPVPVLVALPAHSPLSARPLHYLHAHALPAGTLVRVPLGARQVLGVVWDGPEQPESEMVQLRAISEVLDTLPVLDSGWRQLVQFTARYYQRSMGEVALSALPPQLRDMDGTQLARRLKKLDKAMLAAATDSAEAPLPLSAQQQAALTTLLQQQRQAQAGQPLAPALLFGSTGSGKTEVYLQAAAALLDEDAQAQVLVMVPEINLTPQLEQRFARRFPQHRLVSMHSGMTPAQRLQAWLAAHFGQARIVLGTRMAVLASLPGLRLIVVDEEHDPSYKQQEGARYSARDLAIYRAHHAGAGVLLGSATPSLESWHHSRPAGDGDAGGRYLRLCMPDRIGAAPLPRVRLVDMRQQPWQTVFSAALLAAMEERITRGEQCMVLLNRRGYAPVLHCGDCGWKSECPHCSAYRVFHKLDRTLRCHHCGFTERVPHACPGCGNQDLRTLGQGTEQLEEALAQQLQNLQRPDGSAIRILRMDADTTRHAGSLEQQLGQVHAGDVDVLVGTQMIAKGHDFRHITLVAALNPDSALFSSDFRAPERLFSLLMQAGGRAGRDAAIGSTSELWIQTQFPEHALFAALQTHDYPAFAAQQLEERAAAGMPPFSHQALVRAESRDQQQAQDFLNLALHSLQQYDPQGLVFGYPAIPMTPQRVANRERAQMLLETDQRQALLRLLPILAQLLQQHRPRGILRWAIDVDPLAI